MFVCFVRRVWVFVPCTVRVPKWQNVQNSMHSILFGNFSSRVGIRSEKFPFDTIACFRLTYRRYCVISFIFVMRKVQMARRMHVSIVCHFPRSFLTQFGSLCAAATSCRTSGADAVTPRSSERPIHARFARNWSEGSVESVDLYAAKRINVFLGRYLCSSPAKQSHDAIKSKYSHCTAD